ncbi:hypothetical protein PVAND_007998 [Polypedilum vanderplanki]|uniref:Uncharacterized protein n=1 Tax=Polypedilum vanderplanki TaxID=319348 RepID=A0A9J6C8V9_POLVA|nr:hypothetical protein PVAND_007998 [Polypedilum vanderplanki]
MFWDITYSNNANIDALLNKEDCTLKELLDEEDILQECKTQNQKLVKFLNRPEVVDELIVLITNEPPSDLDERQRFLHPNVACEILTSDLPSLQQRIAEDHTLLNKLFNFFEQKTPLNPLLASFICKTFGTLIMKKVEQDWFLYQTICLHVLEFVKSKDSFLDVMLYHFSMPVVMDLLLTMLNEVEDAKMKSSFLEWINEKALIEKLIDVLRVSEESEKHGIIAQFLIELIKTGRCNRQNDTEDRKSLPNPLLKRMEETQTTTRLIDAILCETHSESGILSGLAVLLCLLENSIIQEPVSQSALQQIIDAEKEHHDEIVASLMSIIQPRVHQLFELLLNPPVKKLEGGEGLTTASLGNVRLQICNLFTVLLETENSSIIEEICKTNFFIELLNLFKQYCWNNFLHNYVKKCFVYGVQAFDTIPNNTQLVISALQKHIIVDCKLADRLLDCWNENAMSQQKGGRRLGYMGHLVDILGAIFSTVSASDEFRALIESSLTGATEGSGDPMGIEMWNKIMQSNEEELKVQKRFLADCDPSERQEYGRDGLLSGFPSNTDENDTEDFAYSFNTSMQNTVNGMSNKYFNEDYTNDDEMEARSYRFEEAVSNNISSLSFDADFDNWDQQQHYQFNNALNLKSHRYDENRDSDEEEETEEDQNDPFKTNDPFADAVNLSSTATSGFDSIIGNNNINSNHLLYGYHNNGVFDQSTNDFLMNFYASQCTTNYPFTATNTSPLTSSYNPFHHNFINHQANINDIDDSNNDNWANFNSSPDNFADFDSHFTSMTPVEVDATTPTNPPLSTNTSFTTFGLNNDDNDQIETTTATCFVATTQVIEISTVPPTQTAANLDNEKEKEEETVQEPTKLEFQLGPSVVKNNNNIDSIIQKTFPTFDELDDEEFFSLRDDSNEMSSLTDDTDKKLINNENTDIPEDDDDDFASADESSSKGNSEDDTNSNGGDQFTDCTYATGTIDEINRIDDNENKNKLNGVERDEIKSDESDDDKTITTDEINTESIKTIQNKLAQTSLDDKKEVEVSSPIVPLENGSA